jgi:glycosyltransferase involved in cell wall biosynthesis
MASPLVSILTPSFNQGGWLVDNMHSVAMQTYVPIEHIVMDAASGDSTPSVLQQAPQHVRWRSEPDRGQSHALNKAFEESRGQIIGWLNADDAYFDEHAVAEAVRIFCAHPEVDVVYGHAVAANARGLILAALWVPPFSYRLLRHHTFIIQPAAFIRRSSLLGRFVDEAYDWCMDRELWLRLGMRCKFRRINRVLAIDRYHPLRKSLTRKDLALIDSARLVSEYHVPTGRYHRAILRSVGTLQRLPGVSLLPKVWDSKLAFAGRVDSRVGLVVRQVAVRRSRMREGQVLLAGGE